MSDKAKSESKLNKKITVSAVAKVICGLLLVGMLCVPFAMLDTTQELYSELENRAMTRWPGVDLSGELNEWYGHYVEDRVGFREPAIKLYMTVVYNVFHEFTEELHMYGKDDQIFPADDGYIKAYQHEATDEELIDRFVTYVDRTNQYCKEKEITFVFLAGLDKKSVYNDYMPDSIHVNEENESIMQMLDRKLTEKNVAHVIPVEEFRERAKVDQIYNVSYDSAHWNDKGAFYGMQLLDAVIRQEHPEIPPLDEKNFKLKSEEKTIEFMELPIQEVTPYYRAKRKYRKCVQQDQSLCYGLVTEESTSMISYANDREDCDKKILVVHDSFMGEKEKFITYRYKESFFVTRNNYIHLQSYIDSIQPDVVVFETAERAFVDDLYMYTELDKVTYE